MKRALVVLVASVAIAGMTVALPAAAGAAGADVAKKKGKGKGKKKGKRGKKLTVCKFGCKYDSIQKAVDRSGKNATIKIKPGKYREGVIVEGHKHDGLTIRGTKKNPGKVVLEGKNAKSPDGLAQNGVEGIDVKRLTVKNLTAQNFATNGIFVRDSNPKLGGKNDCKDYLVKNTHVEANRSYGIYAFGCVGGRITKSSGTLHGDSAFYIGATPPQKKPKWTDLDHLEAYENIQAFSGTNSRYVDIHHNDFWNNGLGVVPNTLDSEPYEPADGGKIRKNNIFWNNFNYYLPNSPVETISDGLGNVGKATINFPIGVGVVLFGVSNWEVKNNNIFGHYKWGSAVFSDPIGNEGDDAVATGNMFINNKNGLNGTDPNAVDFFTDGSGSGNCFQGNTSSTFAPSGEDNDPPTTTLYPTCPAPAGSGTGSSVGDDDLQFGDLVGYVLTDPPENMQCDWDETPHPGFKKFRPSMVTPGPNCE